MSYRKREGKVCFVRVLYKKLDLLPKKVELLSNLTNGTQTLELRDTYCRVSLSAPQLESLTLMECSDDLYIALSYDLSSCRLLKYANLTSFK